MPFMHWYWMETVPQSVWDLAWSRTVTLLLWNLSKPSCEQFSRWHLHSGLWASFQCCYRWMGLNGLHGDEGNKCPGTMEDTAAWCWHPHIYVQKVFPHTWFPSVDPVTMHSVVRICFKIPVIGPCSLLAICYPILGRSVCSFYVASRSVVWFCGLTLESSLLILYICFGYGNGRAIQPHNSSCWVLKKRFYGAAIEKRCIFIHPSLFFEVLASFHKTNYSFQWQKICDNHFMKPHAIMKSHVCPFQLSVSGKCSLGLRFSYL